MVRVLKYVLGTLVALVLVVAFAVFVLQIPMPWKARAEAKPQAAVRALTPIELVEGQPHTVAVPEVVRRSLGMIRPDGTEALYAAAAPPKRPLVMQGSTALDPARIMRIRARFAPAEVVSIKMVDEPREGGTSATPP